MAGHGTAPPLSCPPQVIVGTHGTLKRWMDARVSSSARVMEVDRICILVFDEADEMLKAQGFRDDSVRMMRSIRKATGNRTQILLFSATFNDEVRKFVSQICIDANQVRADSCLTFVLMRIR
jgi:ATP-dependent RNA helicase DDX19/DBP5